jgi:glucokinase
MEKGRVFIGVDIGGTKIAAGLVGSDGSIHSQLRIPMVANSTAQDGLAGVLTVINSLLRLATTEISGIGICAPGPLDPNTGVILNPPNLPCWRNYALAEEVLKSVGLPAKLDNDANAAALAEAHWGAAMGHSIVFYATIGTGIGTGIVFDGRIYHGRTGAAGEGGHVSIDCRGPRCACGKPGCIEALASGTAIARRAQEKILAGESSIVHFSHGRIDSITAEVVGRAASDGDPIAKQILDETIDFLALWLSNIVDLLDPDIIVIGGGASALLSPCFLNLQALVSKYALNPRADEVPVVCARYGADSGIAGGAALCSTSRAQ